MFILLLLFYNVVCGIILLLLLSVVHPGREDKGTVFIDLRPRKSDASATPTASETGNRAAVPADGVEDR